MRLPLWPGAQLGPFRLEAEIGSGGMGVVFRARDERLERPVALKLIVPQSVEDALARERLMREARMASSLNHPNICTVYEVGETEGRGWIAMELVEGRPLREVIPAGGLSPGDAVRYATQIADALAHAHARGVKQPAERLGPATELRRELDPPLDAIRSDPRMDALLARMGAPR